MKNQRYLFQKKKITFAKRIFNKGLNAAGCILLGLKNFGTDFPKYFAQGLPKKDPRFVLIRALLSDNSKDGFEESVLRVNLGRLEREGLIAKGEKKKVYYLTDKGEEIVAYIRDRYSILEKPWDGKIRLVIFDIPENKRSQREWLRLELLLMQYKLLQKSVYIGKYPIPDDFYQELIKNGIFEDVHIFALAKSDKQDRLCRLLEA
jgi:DNA-binding transcriptional regulator PaaX